MKQTAPVSPSIPLFRRISFQLVAPPFMLSIAALLLASVFSFFFIRQQFESRVLDQMDGVVEQKSNLINQWLEEGITTLRIISENTAVFNRALTEDASRYAAVGFSNNYLEAVAEDGLNIETFFLYNMDGVIISASDPAYIGRTVTRQNFYQNSLDADDVHVEPPFFDIAQNQLVTVITDIIEDDQDQPIGVLAAQLDAGTLETIMLERTGLGETGETYLVSGSNNYMITPSRFEGYPQNRAYSSDGIADGLAGNEGRGLYDDYRGILIVGSYRYIPRLDAVLLSEIDEDEAFSIITQIVLTTGIVTGAAIISAGLLALVNALSVAGQIKNLSIAANRIASGQLQERVQITAQNEVGALANTFNVMTDSLVASLDALDKKVVEAQDTNRQLRVANAKAREAARLKSEFLANMSHELRTPLNAILGFTGIMLEGFGGEIDEDARHMTKRVYDNSRNLLTLINDILDIAKIESGRLDLVSEPFNPRQLAQEWKNQIGVLAQEKQLDFTVTVDENLPETMYGDATRLTQVVTNLLSNAIKFTHEGGVDLKMMQKGNTWLISVKDTGIGIPPHAKEYIFEEFRQVDGSSMRAYGGTGLGLAITRKIILTMNGIIHVDSELGKGSTFTVTLPMQVSEENYIQESQELQSVGA